MTARDDHDDLSRRADELQRVLEIHPADFDLQSRGRAFEEALTVRGHGELAAAIRVLTELLTGTLPCGHVPAALVEDPDVAALHEVQPGVPHVWERDDGEDVVLQGCRCPIGKYHADQAVGDVAYPLDDEDLIAASPCCERHFPKTGGRSVDPPEADLPSPHATKES